MRLSLICFAIACVALTARATTLPITADSLAVSPNTNSLMDNADERVENLAQENNPRVRTIDTTAPQNDFEPTWVDWGAPSASPAMRFAAVNPEQNVEEPPEIFTPPMRNLSADPSLGCLEAPFAVCVGMPDFLGPTTIAADSLPKGIAGWWDFDDNAGFDKSGRMNYVTPAPKAGPGFMGFGSSAYFNGSSLSYIEHQPPYSSNELTIMFWIFLIDEPAQGFRTILYKGSKTRFSPSIQLWPESRRLKVRVSTSRSQATSIDTVAAIPVRRWTHVAYVAELEVVRVFVNGILDTKVILPNYPVPNKDPIFLANDPWHLGARMYIDDLRLYSRRVADSEIEAIGDLALPGLGAGLVRLGCGNCKINPAFLSCPNFYHVCSRDELDSGALQVARVMGWVSMANMPYLWHRDDTDLDGKYGTALCCRDN